MVLFLTVSALWLVAAGTARAPVISQPGCPRQPCPSALPSPAGLHVFLWLGIAGAVFVLASLVLLAAREAGGRPAAGTARLVHAAAAAGLAGVLAEIIVVLLVTHVAIANAPLGFENSGEIGAAIAVLGAAQLPLVGAIALVWARLRSRSAGGTEPAVHLFGPGAAIIGIGGMVLSGAAFVAWSLHDGTLGMVVNTRLIAGTPRITNVGAWWPGLLAAMVVLTLVTAACAPGMTSRAARRVPRVPPASETASAPAHTP